MRAALLERLRCPRCHAARAFEPAQAFPSDGGELRETSIVCSNCGERREVAGGIVDLMPSDVPPFVAAEAAGLDRFADLMRDDGWTRESVLALPDRYDGYWWAQRVSMEQTLKTRELGLRPGKRLLDVGSNTCWASAIFAGRGLDVTAIDINAGEMQGLRTADWWFEAKDIYFERVLGVMFELPFADDVFDYVWCCCVLHHNHRANLYRTLREVHRVLRPGGCLIVNNEPCRSLRYPRLRPGREVADYEGHEHVYQPRTYARAARRAGLRVQIVAPWIAPIFSRVVLKLRPDTTVSRAVWLAVVQTVRRVAPLRRAALAYKHYVDGSVSVNLIATKPRSES
jgi:SAM-dependent methyltransferase